MDFLAAYPFPAFVLESRLQLGKHGTHLQPVYANVAYLHVIFGPDYRETSASPFPSNSAPARGLVEALGDDETRKLSTWIHQVSTSSDENPVEKVDHTIVLSLQPSWVYASDERVILEITKTLMDNCWVCTSVPRGGFKPRALTPSPPLSPSSTKSRRTSLRIRDLPSPPTVSHSIQGNSSPAVWKYLAPPSIILPRRSSGPGPSFNISSISRSPAESQCALEPLHAEVVN